MEIKILYKDIDCLIELLYLGNWVANATKMPDKRLKKYDDLYLEFTQQLQNEKDINDEDLHDSLAELIKEYEKGILFKEFAKQYADYHYPCDSLDTNNKEGLKRQIIKNKIVRQLCEKELEKNKFLNVLIKMPELEKELDAALQKIQE